MTIRILIEAARLAANVALCAAFALAGCRLLAVPVEVPF